MCHPSWGRARAAARHLHDLALLRRVRDRIDRQYAQPLDVEALARDVDLPAGHLSRQFRRAYGASPYAYLTARRVERAAVLLRSSDLGVGEVAAAVGCSSPGTFRTRFTELVGMPPGSYRRLAAQAGHAAPGAAAGVAGPAARPVLLREVPPAQRFPQPRPA
ncbi:helix-turn-helix transcriptional regulator [Streptomyces sp. cmx-4-9]|uniref:helix-turn-helix transcriptional regulator n=1 Tax=Streptomyces sp. cmx-4-9 TaxID=2790941 RepID=UPI00397FA43A